MPNYTAALEKAHTFECVEDQVNESSALCESLAIHLKRMASEVESNDAYIAVTLVELLLNQLNSTQTELIRH